jgi:CBS domain-containing protein
MQLREIMTENPSCCGPRTSLSDAAKLMADSDCGEIPVVDERRRPIGVVTDRDIACRGVARGKRPETSVRNVMSNLVVTVTPETSIEDCCKTLEGNQIRRVPVVDQRGACCGMVSQADIAQHAPEHETAQMVRDISRPAAEGSRVGCC